MLHRHVIADAVFGLAGRINAHHRRAVAEFASAKGAGQAAEPRKLRLEFAWQFAVRHGKRRA